MQFANSENCFNLGGRLHRFEPHVRMSPCVDEEWHVSHGGVDMIVVCKLSHRQPFVLVVLPLIHENM